jgi:hypothetical protein
MSVNPNDFDEWSNHGITKGYFQRLGINFTLTYQPPQQPVMYQPPLQPQQPVIYPPLQQPVIYQQPPQPYQQPLQQSIEHRILDPRIRALPETDPRRIKMERREPEPVEPERSRLVEPVRPRPLETINEYYPEHDICIPWLKNMDCNRNYCSKSHYIYNGFKTRICKYWSDGNCKHVDPIYCDHAHGNYDRDRYSQERDTSDSDRLSGYKRPRYREVQN